jgi:hypothetical protein
MKTTKPKKKDYVRWWVLYLFIALTVLSLVCVFITCALHNWFGMVGWILATIVFCLLSVLGWDEIQNNKGVLW